MSYESVELVRRSLEAFARGDFDAAFAGFDPRAEWRTASDEPDRRTHRGMAEIRRFVAALDEPWEDRFADLMEFEDFIAQGDWVVVPWSGRLRGRGSGISIEVSETYAVRVQGGRIVRVDEYRTKEEALEAVAP